LHATSTFELPEVQFSLGLKQPAKVGPKRSGLVGKKATSKENAKVDINTLVQEKRAGTSPGQTEMDYEHIDSVPVAECFPSVDPYSDPIFKFIPTAFSKEFFGSSASSATMFKSGDSVLPSSPLAAKQSENIGCRVGTNNENPPNADTAGPKVEFKIGANVKAKKKFNHSIRKSPPKPFEDILKADSAPKWWTDNVSVLSEDDYDFPEEKKKSDPHPPSPPPSPFIHHHHHHTITTTTTPHPHPLPPLARSLCSRRSCSYFPS
jgi:hypothetical protein